MSTTTHRPAVPPPTTDRLRRTSRAAGIVYLLTFASVPTPALHRDARTDDAPIVLLAAAPIAVGEFSLGVYLVVKGFRPSAVAALPPAQVLR